MIINKSEIDQEYILTQEITIEEIDIDEFVKKIQEKEYQNFEMKGFRKGHAPRSEFEKIYNKDYILNKFNNEFINYLYIKSISTQNVTPLEPANVEILDNNKIKFTVLIMPNINIDLSNIEINYKPIIFEEKMVDDIIKDIQLTHAKKVSTNEPFLNIENQDIEYIIVDENNNEIKKYLVLYNLNKEEINDIKSFLVNVSIGNKKEILIKIDENNTIKGYIILNKIYNKEIPEFNEDFIRNTLHLNIDLKTYKNYLSKVIKNKIDEDNKKEFERIIVQKVLELTKDIKIPFKLIKEVKQDIQQQINNNLILNNQTLDEYLQSINQTLEEYNNNLNILAEQRNKIQIFLHNVINENKIKVTENEVQDYINNILDLYLDEKEKNEIKLILNKKEKKEEIYNTILINKTFDFIKSKIKIINI